jgi:hypothetical protein
MPYETDSSTNAENWLASKGHTGLRILIQTDFDRLTKDGIITDNGEIDYDKLKEVSKCQD